MDFSAEQKEFLKEVFDVDLYNVEYLKVKDGWVKPGDTVYWWSADGLDDGSGPERVIYKPKTNHAANMKEYPDVYSIKKPEITKQYTLDY